MKKITKFFTITLLFMFAIFLFSPVAKAEESEVTMALETIDKIEPGEEFKVDVIVNQNEEGVLGLQGTLNVDTNMFEIVDTEVVGENFFLSIYSEETNMFMIELPDEYLLDNSAYIYETTTIMEITLKAKDDIDVKNTNIEINNIKVVNSEFETIDVEDISKQIKISGVGINTGAIILIVCVVVLVIAVIAGLVLKKKKE